MTQSQTRNLLLVALDWTRPKDPPFSLGHASIITNLVFNKMKIKEKSYSVNSPSFNEGEVINFILSSSEKTTDVAFGGYVWNENAIQKITRTLKLNNYPGRIILGGPQISYLKTGHEKFYPHVDVFIKGYAEESVLRLVQAKNKIEGIAGVKYKGEPDFGTTPNIDLNSLPSPFLEKLILPQRFIRWETQRGCPFKCSFCQHRESDQVLMKRKNFQYDRIEKEIKWISDNKIIQDVAVLDPTFNSGPNYIKVLQSFVDGKFTGKLSLQCRLEMVTDEFLRLVCEINKHGKVVLEFGLQTIHHEEQRIIERPNNIQKIKKILDKVNLLGIEYEISLIFGLPNQTLKSFVQTIDFCIRNKSPIIKAFPLMLLRGTALYERKNELRLIESIDIAHNDIDRIQDDIPHVISSPSFDYTDWKKMGEISAMLKNDYNKNKNISYFENVLRNYL